MRKNKSEINERIKISIDELKQLAKILSRHPYKREYSDYRIEGYSVFPLQKHLSMNYKDICNKYIPEYIIKTPEGFKKCIVCDDIKPENEFMGTKHRCKTCDFLHRNNIKIIDSWSYDEYLIIIDYILNKKVEAINDILPKLNNKSLDNLIYCISKILNIRGVSTYNVRVICDHCREQFLINPSVYLKNENYFCCREHYWEWKKQIKGEIHKDYNRVKTNCDNCNKPLSIILYDYSNKEHHFCSQECYYEFRSKFYIGEKHPCYGKVYTDKERDSARKRTVKLYSDGKFNRDTKPQLITNKLLDKMSINYIREYNCKYYSIDNFLSEYELMIEVSGDYFHANPNKFTVINDMQKKNIKRDKSKRTYCLKYHSIPILYLWEYDINHNLDKCQKLIEEYIKNKGVLSNYQSFNYKIEDDKLLLNEEIVKPYIDWDVKELNKILKQIK